MATTRAELMRTAMQAAGDLIATHDSGLSRAAIRTRMVRIAGDLTRAAEIETNTHQIGDMNVNIVADGRYITLVQGEDVIALSIDEARTLAAVIDEV